MNTAVKQSGEVVPLQPGEVALTPMAMLDRAVASGAGVETIERLMGLQERWEKNQARKAFDSAIAAAKSEIVPVVRNATGHNSKKYADFAAIARAVDPIISKHGLSYRFRSSQGDKINVTCVLSHRDGHSEETTLSGPTDTSGNKNAIQAIGSTLTYLQRYSLVQALGLAASNDDDGRLAGIPADGERISLKQVENIIDLLAAKEMTHERFLKWVKIDAPYVTSIEDIPLALYDGCVEGIKKVKS